MFSALSKIVNGIKVQMKAILRRQQSDNLGVQTKQFRIFKYCMLIVIAGFGCKRWLLPQLLPAMANKEKQQERKQQLHEVKLWWSRPNRSSNDHATHRGRFRDITIREYENRLRIHSQPEKIFGYFASIKTLNSAGKWEVYMTPIDFLRSMMPGIRQPDGLGLNQYRKMSREEAQKLSFQCVPADSIFYKIRPDGLLTFTDYLYLHMLVPMPDHYFEIGFHIFDPNGDNNLDLKGMNYLMQGVTGNSRFKASNSINHYFFGPHLNEKLSLEKFMTFKRKLSQDILLIEFNMLHRLDGGRTEFKNKKVISELAFSTLLLSYSSIPRYDKMTTLERIKKKYKNSKRGVTLEEFMSFFKFVSNIPTIDIALTYHFLAGADISRSTLKHISDIVVGVSLSPNMIDIIFTVFDTDNNGILGRTEFLQAMRHRMARKRRLNPWELVKSVVKCAQSTFFV
ncbi:calcium uptake protein 1 homolog, mitochondrial [Drosophila nasuta]|uniref:calcium uptake protein 1 homolog, mitochondrial n=1 Tax=Drosophila nasuta TaxID=42062 RepID=UPI00295E9410|nr:calcium uptake protein 1 homolog, mitochondrial [Drosophila nasuta]